MNLAALIPAPYRVLALVLLAAALVGFGWVQGAQHVQDKWNAEHAARAQAVADAVLARVAANKLEVDRQAAINQKITKGKEDEIAKLTARLNAAGRLRVGPAICGGGPAPAAQAADAGGGHGADSPGWLVRNDVDQDLKALILAVEKDLSTGRACQAAAREHGLAQ